MVLSVRAPKTTDQQFHCPSQWRQNTRVPRDIFSGRIMSLYSRLCKQRCNGCRGIRSRHVECVTQLE